MKLPYRVIGLVNITTAIVIKLLVLPCFMQLYQEQLDIILINNKSDSMQWNTYNDLRIHLFYPSLFYLLSFLFCSKAFAKNV